MKLQNKVAVITGGNSGIELAVFSNRNWNPMWLKIFHLTLLVSWDCLPKTSRNVLILLATI